MVVSGWTSYPNLPSSLDIKLVELSPEEEYGWNGSRLGLDVMMVTSLTEDSETLLSYLTYDASVILCQSFGLMRVIPGSGILDDLALMVFLFKPYMYDCENLSGVFNNMQ